MVPDNHVFTENREVRTCNFICTGGVMPEAEEAALLAVGMCLLPAWAPWGELCCQLTSCPAATFPGGDDTEICQDHGLGVNTGYGAGRYQEPFSLSQKSLKGEQSLTSPEAWANPWSLKRFHKIKVLWMTHLSLTSKVLTPWDLVSNFL